MSEIMSRVLVAAEAVVICLPLTVLFLLVFLPTQIYLLALAPEGLWSVLDTFASLVILATLVCAWRLVFDFVFGGAQALRRIPAHWWVLPFITAGLGLFVFASGLITRYIEPSTINYFGWGVPFVLPLLHLRLEYQLRALR